MRIQLAALVLLMTLVLWPCDGVFPQYCLSCQNHSQSRTSFPHQLLDLTEGIKFQHHTTSHVQLQPYTRSERLSKQMASHCHGNLTFTAMLSNYHDNTAVDAVLNSCHKSHCNDEQLPWQPNPHCNAEQLPWQPNPCCTMMSSCYGNNVMLIVTRFAKRDHIPHFPEIFNFW